MWKEGKLSLLAKDMPMVNGLAFSPNEKYLYVNGSRDNYVNRYEVKPDGTLANGKLFIDLSKETERGVTDGMRVDTKGNLYETGPGGVWIISPDGKHLGTIHAPEQATNVGFGDPTRRRSTSPRAPASTRSGCSRRGFDGITPGVTTWGSS
jgi:gluconolactonase